MSYYIVDHPLGGCVIRINKHVPIHLYYVSLYIIICCNTLCDESSLTRIDLTETERDMLVPNG